MMTSLAKLFCGITLLTVPGIAYGGYFLLTLLAGYSKADLTAFQKSMFRAGHAHAGVLVLLSLIAQLLLDGAGMNPSTDMAARIAFPLAAMLVSGGFFAAAGNKGAVRPNGFIAILYAGVFVLVAGLLTLGIGLLRA